MNPLKKNENLIYMLIWLMVLALPVFTLRGEQNFNWTRVLLEWVRISPFLLVFILNNNILVPRFLLQKKQTKYIIYLSVTIVCIAFLFDYTRYLKDYLIPEGPQPFNGNWPFDQPPGPGDHLPHRPEMGHLSLWARVFDRVIFSFLVVGFNTAVKLIFRRHEEEKNSEEQQKIHLQTELSFLRQQVSPHFFMNTLNNIHALIDIEKGQAQEAVIQLSHLMRYLLTGSQSGTAVLKDELDFLHSFINLMRLRYSERVEITVDLDVDHPERKIHPLLFVALVENAFKYGVSYSKPSAISIQAKTSNNELTFSVKNSKFQEATESGTGLGLENLRKQLALLYGTNFSLEIHETANSYHVELKIPFADD
jgi:hypothetical protein